MRCENKEQFNKIKDILVSNNIRSIACSGDDDLIMNVYLYDYELVYTTFTNHFNEPEPELTYSEFMKLYGGKEEVFTREDMKEFAYYYGRRSKSFSVEHHLTNFLSERTND